MKLAFRLLAGFLIVAILVGIMGYATEELSGQSVQNAIGGSSVLLAEKILQGIDRDFHWHIEHWKFYSQDPKLQQILTESNQEFAQLADPQLHIDELDLDWVGAAKSEITPFMNDIIESKLSQDLRDHVSSFQRNFGYPVYGEVFVTNLYGANVAQTGKTSDYRQDDEQWWQYAKENKIFMGDVEFDESAQIHSTEMGVAVFNEFGDFLGVIKIVLNIKDPITTIQQAEVAAKYKTTQFLLLDGSKRVIYETTDRYGVLEPTSEESFANLVTGAQGYFIDDSDFDHAGHRLNSAHVHSYATSEGYGSFPGLNWTLFVIHDEDEILAPLKRMKSIILLGSIALIVASILIGFYFSFSVALPIKRLTRDIDEISQGKLDIQLQPSSIPEIQTLIDSLNRVLASLKLAVWRGSSKESLGLGKSIKGEPKTGYPQNKHQQAMQQLGDRSINNTKSTIAPTKGLSKHSSRKRSEKSLGRKSNKKLKTPTKKRSKRVSKKAEKNQKRTKKKRF